jgi:hypothetical protein
LNWSFRFYLCQAIERLGFKQGWQPIIEHGNLLCATFQKGILAVNDRQCHLFYLQLLAEFGDFHRFCDPLTPPSPEIKSKIARMRRSELRHELMLTTPKCDTTITF